jgi:hypothetical protein
MSHDLVYTSAPQGLKPGSRGFCTVASTAGMAKNLTERLESFSGYRHAFMAHEAGGSQNPVNYAHYHTTVGGRKYHILSRIADAGLDYTQRSNKLAHHVALEPSEAAAAPGGPAWVMADDGFFVDRWDGQVRTLASGSQPVRSDRPAGVCQRWKELTGDAGWGGVLAESGLRKGGVISVIFPAGTPVLELVVEALALVPPERRWQVTFSTYFTKAPAGVDCQWRFLLDGTPEAATLRRDVRATVIDLCQPLGQAQGGDLVELARTGVLTKRSESLGAAPAQRVAAAPPRMPSGPPTRGGATDDVRLAPPVLPPPTVADNPVPAPDWLSSSRAASSHWLLFGVGAVSLIATGLVMGAVLFGGRETVPPVEIAEAPLTPEPLEILPEEDEENPIDPEPTEEEPPEEISELPVVEEEPEEPEPNETEEAQPPPDPFADIRARQNRLRLPPPMISEGGDALTSVGAFANKSLNRTAVELARIDVKENTDLDLQLGGSEFQPRRKELKYDIRTVRKDNGPRWEVITESPTAIGSELTDIATFSLKNGAFFFNWETAESPFRLAFCTLKLTVGDKSETCHFEWEVAKEPSIQLKNETGEPYKLPNIGRFYLRSDDEIFLELKFSGMPGARFAENSTRLTLQQNQTAIRIPLKPYYTNTVNPDASLRLILENEDDADSIKTLWLKTTLEGPAPTIYRRDEGSGGSNNVRLSIEEASLQLSEAAIEEHFDQERNKVAEYRKLGEKAFGPKSKWGEESPELRRLIAGRFSELEQEIPRLETPLKVLDDAHDMLKTRLEESSDPKAQGDLRKRMQQNREEAKKPADLLHKLRMERKGLLAKEPQIETVYQRHQLSEPKHVQLARMHLFLEDYEKYLQAWFDAIPQLPHALRNNGRLDYRLYVTVDGREIDLIITEGFPDQASDTGDMK